MTDKIFFLTILLAPFLLLSTYILKGKHRLFKKLFIAHSVTFILCILFVANYSELLTGHDEYGPEQLGLGITFIVIHIQMGFIHGLFLKYKSKNIT